MDPNAIIALIIFLTTFILIITERFHRTVIALLGAVIMVVAGTLFHFYSAEEAFSAIDFDTIGLLFGMMIIVAILEPTGLFQYLGIWVAQKTKGKPFMLMVALGLLTAFLSMVLDNVTTIILIAPVTLIIARILSIDPKPILLAEALLSNVGGTATLVGDPPNVIIGSAAGFSFNSFLIYSLPTVLVALVITVILFRFIFRKELAQEPKNLEELAAMNPRDAIKDIRRIKNILGVLGFVVILFFLHGMLHMPPVVVALLGAAIALIIVSAREDPQPILEKTELSVLLFFAALFMIVGGLEAVGLLEQVAHFITASSHDNLLGTALIILWAGAILSAIVDNIPLTVAMVPIIGFLETQGVATELLWWALVFGVGFGGNGSPIGSTAGVIVMSKSEQAGDAITMKQWFKSGTISMFAALVIASVSIVILSTILV